MGWLSEARVRRAVGIRCDKAIDLREQTEQRHESHLRLPERHSYTRSVSAQRRCELVRVLAIVVSVRGTFITSHQTQIVSLTRLIYMRVRWCARVRTPPRVVRRARINQRCAPFRSNTPISRPYINNRMARFLIGSLFCNIAVASRLINIYLGRARCVRTKTRLRRMLDVTVHVIVLKCRLRWKSIVI